MTKKTTWVGALLAPSSRMVSFSRWQKTNKSRVSAKRKKWFFFFLHVSSPKETLSSYERNTQGEIRWVFMFQYNFKTLRLVAESAQFIHMYQKVCSLVLVWNFVLFRKLSLKAFTLIELFFLLGRKFPVEEKKVKTSKVEITLICQRPHVVLKHYMRGNIQKVRFFLVFLCQLFSEN